MSDGSIPSGPKSPPHPEQPRSESAGLADLVRPGAVLLRVTAATKRHALQVVCEALAEDAGLPQRAVFEAVVLREKLSGTGAGDGVAIPHARVAGLSQPLASFARLDPPHDFDAMDSRPADLVLLLLGPEDRGGEHLKALARVARFLRRADVREKLRAARGVDALTRILLTGDPHSNAAA